MDIRIGVTDNPQPIVLQLADDTDRDDLKARIDTAISGGEGAVAHRRQGQGSRRSGGPSGLRRTRSGRQQPDRVRLIA